MEDAVDEVLSAPEITRLVDRALASSQPEEIAARSSATAYLNASPPSSLQAVSWSAS